MAQRDTVVGQYLADQQATVALMWSALAAHQCDSLQLATAQETLYSRPEAGLLRHLGVQGMSLIVVVLIV